jgi:hypothetical protein
MVESFETHTSLASHPEHIHAAASHLCSQLSEDEYIYSIALTNKVVGLGRHARKHNTYVDTLILGQEYDTLLQHMKKGKEVFVELYHNTASSTPMDGASTGYQWRSSSEESRWTTESLSEGYHNSASTLSPSERQTIEDLLILEAETIRTMIRNYKATSTQHLSPSSLGLVERNTASDTTFYDECRSLVCKLVNHPSTYVSVSSDIYVPYTPLNSYIPRVKCVNRDDLILHLALGDVGDIYPFPPETIDMLERRYSLDIKLQRNTSM